MKVVSLPGDAALIAYSVHEAVAVDGKDVSLDANDSSVWRRTGEVWACVLHTDSITGDPFGRDRP